MADAALATGAVTAPTLEPGPDTVASARCRTSAVVTALVAEAREDGGAARNATRAAGLGTGPFAAAAVAAGGAALATASAGTGRFAAGRAAVVRAAVDWGAMGAMPRRLYGPGS